jgi:lipopolysaccharide export system protein LptA
MWSKNLVRYKDQEKRILTKDFTYNNKKETISIKNGYDYRDQTYESVGKELDYNDITKVGKIIQGTVTGNGIIGSAKVTDFDLKKETYNFIGEAKIINGDYVLETERIDIDNKSRMSYINNPYTIYNEKTNMNFYGNSAT